MILPFSITLFCPSPLDLDDAEANAVADVAKVVLAAYFAAGMRWEGRTASDSVKLRGGFERCWYRHRRQRILLRRRKREGKNGADVGRHWRRKPRALL